MATKSTLYHSFPISRFIPAPRFLKLPIAGIEINDVVLRAVVLDPTPKGGKLIRSLERRLPEGVLNSGEIMQKDKLVEELKALSGELKVEHINFSIPDEKAYLFKVQLPEESFGNVRQGIEFHLDESVPISPDEALFEYEVIRRKNHTGPTHADVNVAVMPRDIVQSYTDLARAAGLEPLSFCTPSQALLHALIPKGADHTFLILHIGFKKTTIAVIAEEVVRYATTVPIGGEMFLSALKHQFSINDEQALEMKRTKSFVKNRENLDFFSGLVGVMSALADEAHKVMDYWDHHTDKTNETDEQIEKIFLSGTEGSLRGLDEYLAVMLKKPVEVGNPWVNLMSSQEDVPALSREISLGYAVAIGLASFDLFA